MTARGRLERRELVLVRLHADGIAGLGEAAPLALRGGALAGADRRGARALPPAAGGSRSGLRGPCSRDCASLGISPQSLAAIEIALLDLRGQSREGRPAGELLGAERRAAGAIATRR